MSLERRTRDYALHLALRVRRQGDKLALFERWDAKLTTRALIEWSGPRRDRKLGTFRSWRAVYRAIGRYGHDEQNRLT